jgi:small-conductance mechanosensitive channel
MNRHKLLCILLCTFTIAIAPLQGFGNTAEEVSNHTEEKTQALSLIKFYTLTNTIPQELIDLQQKVGETNDIGKLLEQLPLLSKQIEQVGWEATMAVSNPNLSYHQLSALEARLIKIRARIDQLNSPIESNIKSLETWYRAWLEKETQLQEFELQTTEEQRLNISPSAIDSLEEVILAAKDLIKSHIVPSLEAGMKIGEQQTRVYTISASVAELIKEINETGTQQTSPSMLSKKFYERLDKELLEEGWENLRLFAKYQQGYLKKNYIIVVICILATFLLAFIIHLSKTLTKSSPRWHTFACRPITTAILLSGTAFLFYDALSVRSNLPPEWRTLALIPLVVSVALLMDLINSSSYQYKLLKLVTFIFALSLLLTVLGVPQPILYLFVFYVSVLGLFYNLYLIYRRLTKYGARGLSWVTWFGLILTLTIVVVGAAGFDQLAVGIFGKVLSVVVFTHVIILMFFVITGLLEFLLLYFPIAIIRKNAGRVVKDLNPILILLLGALWLALSLQILWIYPSLDASFRAISSIAWTIGSISITPGLIIGVGIAGYVTLLFSHGIKNVLLQETLPRYDVDPGVQVSITRLVHYAVMTIGFLIILRILGFRLGQVAIIGGALGVGIGFGLQAIVNNFVSGLILLFERPVKVGDVVEVGQEVGEVKELGLRATTVQTFDNAEIVIPNSELITKNVTNWTLAEKRVRVRVPIGVAYGSDVEKVLRILLACAHANPTALTTPESRALFRAFGDSSLNFEPRVWIPDFNDKLRVLSELNQDIESEFDVAGVVVPFPQRDLHIRSVDQEVTSALNHKATDVVRKEI